MKKCFKFLTWEEQNEYYIKNDNSNIMIITTKINNAPTGFIPLIEKNFLGSFNQSIPTDETLKKLCE